MNVLNRQVYEDWKKKNNDSYGLRCFTYAEDVANKLEYEIDKDIGKDNKTAAEVIKEKAKKICSECDYDGITGFMYGMAISILSNCWIYGKEIREWHNIDTQIGNEGEEANKNNAVLNPAIINIKT